MIRYRVLVCGSRHWHCRDLVERVVSRLRARHGPNLLIIHGAARGVDLSFADACTELGVDQEPHPAEWQKYGNGAGPRPWPG